MKIREIYKNLKEKAKDYFGLSEKLTEEQLNYVLSGINQNILDKYKIVYSPNFLIFKPDEKGTRVENSLERKLINHDLRLKRDMPKKDYLSYLVNLKEEIKKNHKKNMETLRLNYLRKLNEFYSKIVETYSNGMESLREIFVYNRADGSSKIKFV